MDDFPATVTRAFVQAYRDAAGRVRELAAGFSDEAFWTKPYPYGNSFGHLVLHLTGNLNYYIGAQIAGMGYVRDREREFSETVRLPKEEVLQNFDAAIKMIVETLKAQTAERWAEPYEAVNTDHDERFGIVLNCASHIRHHIGQMIYLERELNRR